MLGHIAKTLLVMVVATLVVFSVPVGLFLGFLWFNPPVDTDRVQWQGRSPDGRRELQLVFRDRAVGFGMDTRFGVFRLRDETGGDAGIWREFGSYSDRDMAAVPVHAVWMTDRCTAIFVGAAARFEPARATVSGVDIEIRASLVPSREDGSGADCAQGH